MNTPLLRSLAFGIAGGVLVIALIVFIFAPKDAAKSTQYAGSQVTPTSATDAVLLDGSGKPAHLLDPSAAATFVFFGYTHCPDECPLALATLGRAYRTLPPRERSRTRIVFVTVDPKHDTPPTMQRYVAHFDPHIVGLTGTHDALAKVWSAYGVDVQPQARELVGHGGTIYAIDSTNHVILIYPPDVKAADLTHDAKLLAS